MRVMLAACILSVFFALFSGCAPKKLSEVRPTSLTDLSPTIVQIDQIEAIQPPSGKARVKVLAQGKNAFLAQLWIAPGAGVPLHRDVSEEYLYVLEGGGKLTINGEVRQISVGSAVFMPAKAQVSFANGNAPTVVLQVFADPASATKYDVWQPVSK